MPTLTWTETGIPVSTRFDDPYFSLENGLAETEHVFLAGNDLPARFRAGFHIAELGFGTGLNALAAWAAWEASGMEGPLRFTSFEAFPLTADQMARALAAFPSLARFATPLLDAWDTCSSEGESAGRLRRVQLSCAGKPAEPVKETRQIADAAGYRGMVSVNCEAAPTAFDLTIIEGDANSTLPDWPGLADAWFLDGFSPARNPGLWSRPLLAEVARHTAAGGSFATYSAAGQVRQALAEAGFAVERVPGYGRKRHMTRGRL